MLTWQRSYDGNGGNAQSGSTGTCVLTNAVQGEAAFISVKVSSNNRTISTFVDDKGSTWTSIDSTNDATDASLFTYYCASLAGNTPTVTVTFDSSAANNVYVFGDGYTNIGTTVDAHNTAENLSAASIAPSITTTVQPALLYCVATSNTTSVRPLLTPAGMTKRCDLPSIGNATERCTFELRLTSTGVQNPTVAVSGGNSSILAVLLDITEIGGVSIIIFPLITGGSLTSIIGKGVIQ